MQSVVDRLARLRDAVRQDFPEAWIPSSEHAELAGEFVRLERGSTIHGAAWIAVVRTEDGSERSLWLLHTVLRNEFTRLQPKPGELLVVRYLGAKESVNGQSYEGYRVLVEREGDAIDWNEVGADREDTGSPAGPSDSESVTEDSAPL